MGTPESGSSDTKLWRISLGVHSASADRLTLPPLQPVLKPVLDRIGHGVAARRDVRPVFVVADVAPRGRRTDAGPGRDFGECLVLAQVNQGEQGLPTGVSLRRGEPIALRLRQMSPAG
ncbi:hypothetical protein GCM10018952_48050 [Streptosporangium vulgare]